MPADLFFVKQQIEKNKSKKKKKGGSTSRTTSKNNYSRSKEQNQSKQSVSKGNTSSKLSKSSNYKSNRSKRTNTSDNAEQSSRITNSALVRGNNSRNRNRYNANSNQEEQELANQYDQEFRKTKARREYYSNDDKQFVEPDKYIDADAKHDRNMNRMNFINSARENDDNILERSRQDTKDEVLKSVEGMSSEEIRNQISKIKDGDQPSKKDLQGPASLSNYNKNKNENASYHIGSSEYKKQLLSQKADEVEKEEKQAATAKSVSEVTGDISQLSNEEIEKKIKEYGKIVNSSDQINAKNGTLDPVRNKNVLQAYYDELDARMGDMDEDELNQRVSSLKEETQSSLSGKISSKLPGNLSGNPSQDLYQKYRDKLFYLDKEKQYEQLDDEDRSMLEQVARYDAAAKASKSSSSAAGSRWLAQFGPEQQKEIEQYRETLAKKGYDMEDLVDYQIRINNANDAEEKEKEIQDYVSKNAGNATVASLATIPVNAVKGIDVLSQLDNTFAGKPVDQNAMVATAYTDTVRGEVGSELEEKFPNAKVPIIDTNLARALYDGGMSLGDMMFLQQGLGNTKAITAVMGTSAGASEMKSVLDKGGTTEEAYASGLLYGIEEGFFEKFSIENLQMFKQSGNSDTVREVFKNLTKQFITEGSEESATEIANVLTDNFINGDNSDFFNRTYELMNQGYGEEEAKTMALQETAQQVGQAGFVGAFTGAASGSVYSSIGYQANKQFRKEVGQAAIDNGEMEEYQTYARAMDDAKLTKANNSYEKAQSPTAAYNLKQQVMTDVVESIEVTTNQRDLQSTYQDIVETFEGNDDILQYATLAQQAQTERISNGTAEAYALQKFGERNDYNEVSDEDVAAVMNSPRALEEVQDATGHNIQEMNSQDAETIVRNYMATQDADTVLKAANVDASGVSFASSVQNENRGTVESERDIVAPVSNAITYQGNEVQIESISNASKGIVKLSNGKVASIADVDLGNSSTQRIYNYAFDKLGKSTAVANEFIRNYDSNIPPATYINEFTKFYNAGYSGKTIDSIKGSAFDVLSDNAEKLKQAAYNAGKAHIIKVYAKNASEENVDVVEALSKVLGKRVNVEYSDTIEGNGEYDPKTNTIYISSKSVKPGIVVLSHELTHYLEQADPEGYEKYKQYVLDYYKENYPTQYEERLKQLKDLYKKTYTADRIDALVEDEIVANATEMFLTDEKAIQKFANTNKSIAQKILDFISDFIKKIQNTLKNYDGSWESRALQQDMAFYKEAQKLWMAAVKNAQVNNKEAEQSENTEDKNGIREDLDKYTEHEIDNWSKSKRIVVYKNQEMYEKFIEEAKTGDNKRKIYFGKVDSSLAARIKEETGADTLGMNVALQEDEIKHALNGHSNTKKETEMGQIPLTKELFLKIPELYNNPDYIEESKEEYEGHPCFNMYKMSGDILIGFHYIGSKGKGNDLRLQTFYVRKGTSNAIDKLFEKAKEKSLAPAVDNVKTPPTSTSKTTSGTALYTDNVSQNSENINRKSLKEDSDGNALSTEQKEFFKDSKVVDEDGRLKKMYHGTPTGGFTVFRNGISFFTDREDYADNYQNPSASSRSAGSEKTNPQTYEVYLNIKNPLDIRNANDKQLFVEQYVKGGYALGINPYVEYQDTTQTGLPSWEEADNIYEFLEDNDMLDQYDGIVVDEGAYQDEDGNPVDRGIAYVTFSPEQIKSVDNKKPTEDEDIRFSLKEPVEETKDLIAVHNMQQSELLKTIDLGGFPMPLIAVTKANMGHSEYGDISVLFGKDTIDPEFVRANKVYSGDAWTPVYPTIEYKANEAVEKRIRDKYYAIANKDGYDAARPLYNYQQDLGHQLDRDGGESQMIERALEDTGLMQVFLADIGRPKVETIYSEERTELSEADVEQYDYLINGLGENVVKEAKVPYGESPIKYRKEWVGKYGERFIETYKGYLESIGMSDNEIDNVLNNMKLPEKFNLARKARTYLENGPVTIIQKEDYDATNNAIREEASKNNYSKWIRDLLTGAEEKKGIRNNRDPFTNSGDRRSFEALHYEETLENVVRAMKEDVETGGVALFSGMGIWGVSTREYSSIDDIKKDSDRIKELSQEEYSEIKNGFGQRFQEIADSITDKTMDNQFMAADNAMANIVEAVRNAKTKSGIKNYINRYSLVKATDSTVEDIISLVSDISKMPTTYFEAKPQRAVGLDEIKAVVVPNNASEELIKALQDSNINTLEYEAGNDKSRIEVVNNLDDVRFSLKEQNTVLSVDDDLREQLDTTRDSLYEDEVFEEVFMNDESVAEVSSILEEGFNALKNTDVDKKKVNDIAKKFKEEFNSNYGITKLSENIEKVFAYIQNNDQVSYDDMVRIMSEVCMPVVEDSGSIDKQQYDTYRDFKGYIRSKRIKLSEQQKSEIAYVFGSYEDFRRSALGKGMVISSDGTYLDNMWDEIVQKSNGYLFAETNSNEQAMALIDALDTMKPVASNDYGMDTEHLAYDMALRVYEEYFKYQNNKELQKVKRGLSDIAVRMKQESKSEYQEALRQERLKAKQEISNMRNVYMKQIEDLQSEMGNATDKRDMDTIDGYIADLEGKLEDLKTKNTEDIAKLKAQYRNTRLNKSINTRKTEVRKKIKNITNDFEVRLTRPKGQRYIPPHLIKAVADVAGAIDVTTGRSEKLLIHMENLKNQYQSIKDNADYMISGEYDEQVFQEITSLVDKFRGSNIYDMNLTDLEELYNVLRIVKKHITDSTKMIDSKGAKDAYETRERVIEEIRSTKGSKDNVLGRINNRIQTGMLSPMRMFRRIVGYKSDSEFVKLSEMLNEGQNKMIRIQQEMASTFDSVVDGKKNQKLAADFVGQNRKDWVSLGLTDENGKEVFVPKSFRVSLFMHLQNQANVNHIINGGLTIPEEKAFKRGDLADAYGRGTRVRLIDTEALREARYHGDAYEVARLYGEAEKKLQAAVANLTEYEKEWIKCAEKFYWEQTGDYINETSMKLKGYNLARVKHYFPIKTDNTFTKTDFGLIKDGTLEGAGYLKERKQAGNPILLEDITRVTQRTRESVSSYAGLAIPIRNFNKVWAGSLTNYKDSVSKAIQMKWGKNANNYIENMMKDLQGARQQQSAWYDKIRGNFAGATLTLSASVTLKQAASYPTAASVVGWGPLAKALASGGKNGLPISRADTELINKYTGLLWHRSIGGADADIADVKSNDSLANKINSKVPALTNWIQAVDIATVGRLWSASEYYVKDNFKEISKEKDEEAYYMKVAEVYNRIIQETQPNYTTMQRNDLQRSPNALTKQLLMFTTQRFQNYNIFYDSYANMVAKTRGLKDGTSTKAEQKEAVKEFASALSSQLVQGFVVSLMTLVGKATLHNLWPYRDDDDEYTKESIWKQLMIDWGSALAGMMVGGTELYNFILSKTTDSTYYELSIPLLDTVNGLIDGVDQLITASSDFVKDDDKNPEELIGTANDLAMQISKAFGIPLENVEKLVKSINYYREDAKDGQWFTSDIKYSYDSMVNSLKEGNLEDFEKRKQSLLDQGKKQSSIDTAIVNYLKGSEEVKQAAEDRLNGELDGYESLMNSESEFYTQDMMKRAFNGVYNSLKEEKYGSEESGGQEEQKAESIYEYRDLYATIDAGNDPSKVVNDFVNTYKENGKDTKQIKTTLKTQLSGEYKKRYNNGSNAERSEIMRKLYSISVDGQQVYTSKDFDRWNKDNK